MTTVVAMFATVATGVLLVTMLPLMIPHYALGVAASLLGKAWLWPVLIANALLVGWPCAVMAAATYYVAVRAGEAAGVALAPRSA